MNLEGDIFLNDFESFSKAIASNAPAYWIKAFDKIVDFLANCVEIKGSH